ncbi:MAG: hypothetical protein HQL69_15475 [Magnetococcales bacterium]|nr:hypothetical protein [Magnetococcales bacterium]
MLEGGGGEALVQLLPRDGQFGFEMKGFYDYGRFHGAGNYQIGCLNQDKPSTVMRAYDSKDDGQVALVDVDGALVKGNMFDDNTPAEVFLDSLSSPTSIRRNDVFIRGLIFKLKKFANSPDRWRNTSLVPGDTVYQFYLIREMSLSQFTFNTIKQFKKFDRKVGRLRGKYGQSFESYFLNPDGSLNYKRMIDLTDFFILNGSLDLERALKKNLLLPDEIEYEHPALSIRSLAQDVYNHVISLDVRSGDNIEPSNELENYDDYGDDDDYDDY